MDKTLAIDFDGVIHSYGKYVEGKPNNEPIENAKQSLELLEENGYTIVIHTARENILDVREWLAKNQFKDYPVSALKPKALAYIDDRGIRFTNWHDIVKYFVV